MVKARALLSYIINIQGALFISLTFINLAVIDLETNERFIEELSGKDVFTKFPTDVLAQLVDYSLARKFVDGEYLCRQGEVWPYVIYLDEGQLKLVNVVFRGKRTPAL